MACGKFNWYPIPKTVIRWNLWYYQDLHLRIRVTSRENSSLCMFGFSSAKGRQISHPIFWKTFNQNNEVKISNKYAVEIFQIRVLQEVSRDNSDIKREWQPKLQRVKAFSVTLINQGNVRSGKYIKNNYLNYFRGDRGEAPILMLGWLIIKCWDFVNLFWGIFSNLKKHWM